MYDITAGIVVYNTKRKDLKKAVSSFLNTDLNVKLRISDNSPTDKLSQELEDFLKECEKDYGLKNIKDKVEYIFNNNNGGYGWGHNKIIEKLTDSSEKSAKSQNGKGISKYHLILNPDIYFEKGTLEKLFDYMENNPETGQIMPKVIYPDGEPQYLCKLMPTPVNLIFRRFLPIKKIKEKFFENK